MSGGLNPTSTGAFPTSRRGGLSGDEVRQIAALRNRSRPMPWQAIADHFGRCIDDIRAAVCDPNDGSERKPDPIIYAVPKPEGEGFWNAQTIARMKALYVDQGLTAERTSAILGCSHHAVIGKASRLGWKKKSMARGLAA